MGSVTVAVRRCGEADPAALAELDAACFSPAWTAAALAAELAQRGALGLLLTRAAAPIGYALFRRLLDEAELLRIGVLPGERGRGFATQLLAHGLGLLREEGVVACLLEVREDNAAAVAVYRHAGFAVVGRRRSYYPDGTTALLMTLPL